MKANSGKRGKAPSAGAGIAPETKKKILLYLLQLLLCLLPQAAAALLLLADAQTQFAYDLCFVLLPFIAVPLLAVLLPFICSRRGIHPLLTFFPAGLFMLVNFLYTDKVYRLVAAGCMVISLISACAGAEKLKREERKTGGGGKK